MILETKSNLLLKFLWYLVGSVNESVHVVDKCYLG